jgi:hypothetical protein
VKKEMGIGLPESGFGPGKWGLGRQIKRIKKQSFSEA